MFNPIKSYRSKQAIKNLRRSVVSAEEAYSSDPHLLRPFAQALTENIVGENGSKNGPVWSAITLISESIAKSPIYVGKRDEDNPNSQGVYDKESLLNAHSSVLNRPNPFINRQTFWSMFVRQYLIRGNAYAWIRRENDTPVALHIGDLLDYKIRQRTDELGRVIRTPMYNLRVWQEDGKRSSDVEVSGRDVLRIHGPGYDYAVARSPSPLEHAVRKSILMFLQSIEYQYKNMAKGPTSKGIVTLKGTDYTPKILQDMVDELKKLSNLTNSNPWTVLPPTAEYTAITQPAVDTSLFEALQFTIDDVARVYNIPAALIGGTPVPQMGVGYESVMAHFINNCLQPIAQRLEDSLFRNIIPAADKNEGYIVRVDLSSFGHGTITNRITNAERAVKSSLMTPNESRRMLLGLGSIDDPLADRLAMIAGAPSPNENRETEERREEQRPDSE